MNEQKLINNATMQQLSQMQDPNTVISERNVALLQIQALIAISLGIAELNLQLADYISECRDTDK